jgi:hypothetical protein
MTIVPAEEVWKPPVTAVSGDTFAGYSRFPPRFRRISCFWDAGQSL